MKILQITSTFFPVMGGQEKVVYEISKGLVDKGHEVTILTTDLFSDNKLPKKETIEGMNVVRFENKFFLGGYGYSPKAMNWLKDNWEDYDAIHSHGYNRFLSEFSVNYLKDKKPAIFTAHGFHHTKKNYFFKMIHDLTLGKFLRYAKKCTALTKLDFEKYANLGVKKTNIVEIPNGIHLSDFQNIGEKVLSKVRKKFGLKEDFILCVGRIHRSKGFQYVIDAIKNLKTNLVIVGRDFGYKKELEEKIKKLEVGNKVKFLEEVNDKELISIYKLSEFFILFSEFEGFGVTVLETMAAGKPIIVSDRGSLPLLVEEGKTGFVVPFKNVEKLTKKINFLLKNNSKRVELGENCKVVSKGYDWKEIINNYEDIYRK